jgi:hypothetical protein
VGEVKSAFEKAMEKMNSIEALTPNEKAEMKDREDMKSLLALFFRSELSRDQIWQKFKGIKPSLLTEAQHNITDSLRLGTSQEEFRQRKDGILAIEALKERRNPSGIESTMNTIERLQMEYDQAKEKAIQQLRSAMEQNPQLRMRPVRTPDGRTVYQATPSVDETMQAKMSEFLSEHQRRYEEMFTQALDRLRKELK